MRIANLKQCSLHWRQDGNPEGKRVVFANSLGTDLRLWDKVIPLLPQDLCFIRFDKRGHGLSSMPPAPYSMDELVSDVEQFLDQLGARDVLFVGLSIGGMIAQGLAVRRPDLVKALVLSNTAAKMGDARIWQERIDRVRAGRFGELVDPIMERWFSPHFRQSAELMGWKNMLSRCPADGYWGCCAALAEADFHPVLGQIRQPTLGIGGDLDGSSPPEQVRETIEKIDKSRFEVIEGTGHLPCVEDPQGFGAVLTQFLKEIDHVQSV